MSNKNKTQQPPPTFQGVVPTLEEYVKAGYNAEAYENAFLGLKPGEPIDEVKIAENRKKAEEDKAKSNPQPQAPTVPQTPPTNAPPPPGAPAIITMKVGGQFKDGVTKKLYVYLPGDVIEVEGGEKGYAHVDKTDYVVGDLKKLAAEAAAEEKAEQERKETEERKVAKRRQLVAEQQALEDERKRAEAAKAEADRRAELEKKAIYIIPKINGRFKGAVSRHGYILRAGTPEKIYGGKDDLVGLDPQDYTIGDKPPTPEKKR